MNVIEDKALKENIANTALGLLTEGVDYKELAYTKVEFGYLFDVEEHGIEALFKVITDTTIAYFAVQLNKLMRLNLTEELYKAYVEGFTDCNN